MPIKVSAPVELEFVLEKSDEKYGNDGEPTRITVRQATQAGKEKRARVFSEVNRIFEANDDSLDTVVRQSWTWEELKRMEVYLTLVDCNIADENDKPLFKFSKNSNHQTLGMTTDQFATAWGKLPPDVCDEIHAKVLEVNLNWKNPLG